MEGIGACITAASAAAGSILPAPDSAASCKRPSRVKYASLMTCGGNQRSVILGAEGRSRQ